MIRSLTGIGVIAIAIPAGWFAGVNGLLGVAFVTGQRWLALVVAAVLTVTVAAWIAERLAGRVSRSPRRVGVVVGFVALIAATPLTALLLFGGSAASVPSSDGVAYWDLPTGSRIAYRHTPARDGGGGVPVILVHGGPGSPDRDPAGLADTLADAGLDVYAYHQFGAGLSSRSTDARDHTVARHVADLEAIRVAIRADRIHLVGASWGAQLVAAYLATHPDRVARAAVASPAPIWPAAYTDDQRLTEGGRADQAAVLGRNPRFLLPHILLGFVGPDATMSLLPDEQVDGPFEAMVRDLDMWAGCSVRSAPDGPDDESGRGFGFWANALATRDGRTVADPRPALAGVSTPVLVLRAACDYIAWPAAREYRDILRNARLVPVEDAGHVIAEDQPARYRELIRAHITGQRLASEPYLGTESPWAT